MNITEFSPISRCRQSLLLKVLTSQSSVFTTYINIAVDVVNTVLTSQQHICDKRHNLSQQPCLRNRPDRQAPQRKNRPKMMLLERQLPFPVLCAVRFV